MSDVDETGWKVGHRSCYLWAFSTALHVLFRCGVSRGKAEAQAILGDQFRGINGQLPMTCAEVPLNWEVSGSKPVITTVPLHNFRLL